MAENIGKVVKPVWHVLTPDLYDDSLILVDRSPFPSDPDASPSRRSHKAGLIGVLSLHLNQAQLMHPDLSPSLAYLDNANNVRVGQLPAGVNLGEHADFPGYLFAAIELGHYALRPSLGVWEYGHSFIEPRGEVKKPGGYINILGVHDKEILARTQPGIPIVERLLGR